MLSKSDLLAALAVGLVVVGLLAFVADLLLVSGVCFLAIALTIYVREKDH